MSGNPLPPDRFREALARVADWRLSPLEPVACPVCEEDGLVIEDRSTRPYAEWYVLSCPSCGLGHTIHIPMSPIMSGGD
ncbi:conserved protein of unknown function [Hyphomicrobium sp. 1Nfss2.1]|uniref:hypothetical protein n=1 Tax=Hyphomicrobium sp. 1Nfss2.1 TaxID=3413936 RepID=UPI003C7C2D0E